MQHGNINWFSKDVHNKSRRYLRKTLFILILHVCQTHPSRTYPTFRSTKIFPKKHDQPTNRPFPTYRTTLGRSIWRAPSSNKIKTVGGSSCNFRPPKVGHGPQEIFEGPLSWVRKGFSLDIFLVRKLWLGAFFVGHPNWNFQYFQLDIAFCKFQSFNLNLPGFTSGFHNQPNKTWKHRTIVP